MRIKLMVSSVLAALIISLGVAAPASAWDCKTGTPTKTSTSTSIKNSGCKGVQAGIWRYISSYPTHYVGPIVTTTNGTSTVTSTSGTDAGHDYRVSDGVWGGWLAF